MIVRAPILIVCVIAVSATWLGCGGSSGSESATAMTKAEFIKQADAICTKADKEQITAMTQVSKEVSGNVTGPKGQEQIILQGGLPAVQKEIEELRELGAPQDEEQQVNAIVGGFEKALAKAEADPLHGLESSFNSVDQTAAKYGFKACAEPL